VEYTSLEDTKMEYHNFNVGDIQKINQERHHHSPKKY